jgi:dolichol kinase
MIKAEVFRKLMNLWAIFIPILYYLLPQRSARLILLAVTLVVVVADFVRLHVNGIKEGWIIFFGSFMRRREFSQLNGATFLMLGCLVTALLFSKPIVICASTFIIVGDTFAALLGQNLKGPKIFRKTLWGSIGFLASNVLAGLILHSLLPLAYWQIFVGAFAATVFESLPVPWDDNFAVPILTGVVMSFL